MVLFPLRGEAIIGGEMLSQGIKEAILKSDGLRPTEEGCCLPSAASFLLQRHVVEELGRRHQGFAFEGVIEVDKPIVEGHGAEDREVFFER